MFYAQIGRARTGGNPEHFEWVPPSQQSARIDRSVTQIDVNNPGTHMACANAAAFASLAMVFEDEDPEYSAEMLQHAIDLYNFGDTYRGDHYNRLNGEPYPTNDFTDDLLVGAIWLYKATGDQAWLDKAVGFFPSVEFSTGWTMHYRDHQYEGFLLLAQILGEQRYYDAAERWIDNEIDNAPRTNNGLYFRSDFLAASFAQAMAFGAYYYADLRGDNFSKASKYKDFAFRQIGYVLGDNPRNSSYVSGFGNNFPRRIHHRAASGVAQNAQVDDMHELTGALCGGPFQDDSWNAPVRDVKRTEPAISNQAFFVGMAAMVLQENGTTPIPRTEGTIEIENNFSVVNETGTNNTVAVDVTNPGASNGRYVRLFDAGDELSTAFTVSEAGDYTLDLRVRTGELSADSTTNLASEYEIRIDDAVQAFAFVEGSASELDNDTYWGELTSTQNLSEGSHTVSIRAKVDWLKADRLTFALIDSLSPENVNTVTVRARGVDGSEIFELLVDNNRLGDQKKVSQDYINYVFEDVPSGSRDIKVRFVNDISGRDMQVDYIMIGETIIQAEDQAVNTSVWQNGSCGGGNSEIMNCTGEIHFGSRTIGGATALKTGATADRAKISSETTIYPNPAARGNITVAGPEKYNLEVINLSGRSMLTKENVSGVEQLDVIDLPSGMYLFKIYDQQTGTSENRKVIIR